jgi:hypothetical protein
MIGSILATSALSAILKHSVDVLGVPVKPSEQAHDVAAYSPHESY